MMRAIVLLLVSLLIAAPIRAAAGGVYGQLEEHLREAFGKGTYLAPNSAELLYVEKLFTRLLQNHRDAKVRALAASLDLEWIELAPGRLLLRERKDARYGRGIYAFREDGGAIALQAPHSRSDRSTGSIAARLIAERRFAAAAWNSLPRREKNKVPGSGADLAHLDDTWMMAFSRAFAGVYPEGRIVQLHGYSAAKRRTARARELDAIVSAGHVRPSLAATDITHCLQDRGVAAAGLYPIEVRELGGTTNRIGQALRAAGFFGFVHLEMSKSLRSSLLEHADRRKAFGRCLLFVGKGR